MSSAEPVARLGGLSLQQHDELQSASPALSASAHVKREGRGATRQELQEAVKHGRRERANPGPDGKPRWRYTHEGVVYVTDETSRHEIASWPMADAADCPAVPRALLTGATECGEDGGGRAHIVLIVDHSGSMRKDDVRGYPSRTAAVYDCLARELVEPLIRANLAAGAGAGDVEVSLIEMSKRSRVLLERHDADDALLEKLAAKQRSRAYSHGNYLPALDAALELLQQDAALTNQLFVVFLSDGAPSDHNELECPHGIKVWQCQRGMILLNQPMLRECSEGKSNCRYLLRDTVTKECVEKVKRIGDLLGRDRVSINTVAFGPLDEDYKVLEAMAAAAALPRGSFQKLGLPASALRAAFTALSSSLTTLLHGAAGTGPRLTRRTDIAATAARQAFGEGDTLQDGAGWRLHTGGSCLSKQRWNLVRKHLEDAPYTGTSSIRASDPAKGLEYGLAHATHKFAEGAERVVFQCSEVVSTDGGTTGVCVGRRLVAKESRFQQRMADEDFHLTFCRAQAEAEQLAQLFNERLAGPAAWQVRFLPCHVYTYLDQGGRHVQVLVEEELEGKYTKWNNNAGCVYDGHGVVPAEAGPSTTAGGYVGGCAQGAEAKGSEDAAAGQANEEERGAEGDGFFACASGVEGSAADVPQAFSHFTYCATKTNKLFCDLQGVWNPTDGFTLTDPVMHHTAGARSSGGTDKGPKGMAAFFATHTCSALCRRLGLAPGPGQPVQQVRPLRQGDSESGHRRRPPKPAVDDSADDDDGSRIRYRQLVCQAEARATRRAARR